MRKLLIIAFLALVGNVHASHIIGGEVYYDYLGNDQYRVTFEIYRDCNGFTTALDNPLDYTIFYANGTVFTVRTAVPVIDTLPVVYDDPCVTPPSDICVQRGIYVDIVTMPATPDGYYLSYQRCCWTAAIQNILVADNWGLTISTSVPGTNLVSVENNSARYDNYPSIVLCSGQTLDFNHSATDPDGDSLVYYLCTPATISQTDPAGVAPNPENPAPYPIIPWEAGFSDVQPFGPGSNITIDNQNGAMSFTPSLTGMFVAAVCVEEWRNGVLINMKSRTFGYRIVNCAVQEPMQVDVFGDATLIEDCGSAGFIVIREDTTESVVLQLLVSGTASNGVDYNFLPDTLILEAGVATDTITVIPYLDGITEGDETLIFSIIVENVCDGTFDTTTAIITIVDYLNMVIQVEDSINVCDESQTYASLWSSVSLGVPPYYYAWSPLPYANNDTLVFPTSDLDGGLTMFSVGVSDACDKVIFSPEIQVWNQCKLMPPNVITVNGDGINDLFVIKNREDYDRVHLTIINRWGNLIYENEDYKDDWNGYDKSGAPLNEGVYFYTVTPMSEKFIYDDQDKTLYTAHGFFYIVK